jgi:hypothetical protein
LREPDNIAESKRELKLVMQDKLRSYYRVNLDGAADARVEPEDLLLVALKPNDNQFIWVESVGFNFNGDANPIFDMGISGYIWDSGNPRRAIFVAGTSPEFVEEKEQSQTLETNGQPTATITIGE